MKSLFSAFPESGSVGSGIAKANKPVLKGAHLAEKGTSTQLSKQYVLIMIKSAGERLP